MNNKQSKKNMVIYNGGFLPKEKIEIDKKITHLLENPPLFDVNNKNQIKRWAKKLVDLYKS